jgi:hypothetical protein
MVHSKLGSRLGLLGTIIWSVPWTSLRRLPEPEDKIASCLYHASIGLCIVP